MTYIVHGATGAQGSPVLSALSAAGQHATAAVRDISGVTGAAVAVDLTSTESLVAAYAGASGVFVHLPVGPPDMQAQVARAVVAAVRQAKPPRVVFSTSGYGSSTDAQSPAGIMAAGLADSGTSYATVEPRLFLENLLLPPVHAGATGDGMLSYPLRSDYAVSWASHLDVADVVVRLLTDTAVTGVVSVGALPGLVGDDLAEGFSRHYDKPIAYDAMDPEAFGALIIPMFGEAGARPVIDSYLWRATQDDEMIPEDTAAQNLLGIYPRPVHEWLGDLAV
jgi:uncharacterized protein YbjT (DUF2867 family)